MQIGGGGGGGGWQWSPTLSKIHEIYIVCSEKILRFWGLKVKKQAFLNE